MRLRAPVALLFSIASLCGIVSCAGERSGTIDVGAALPLTGDNASYGEKARDGVTLAIDAYNSSSNRRTPSIRLRYEDTQGDAAGGATAMQTLLLASSPLAVIGDITSGATAAMIPIADQRHVVLLSPTASAASLSGKSPYFYRLWPTDAFETRIFARYLVSSGVDTVAALSVQNEYGQGVREIFSREYPAAGGTLVSQDAYQPSESNFRPILQRLARLGVNAIYIIGYYKDAAQIMSQARALKQPFRFFGTTTVGDPAVIRLAGPAADGLVFSELAAFDTTAGQSPGTAEFLGAFRKRFAREPGWAEAHGYDAASLVIAAIAAGAQTSDSLRSFLKGVREYPGATGRISFDSLGDVQGRTVAVKRIADGHIQVVTRLSR